MTSGDIAYELLLETQEKAEALWEAVKQAKMDHRQVEVIRNFNGGLSIIRTAWEQERAHWREQ